MLLMKMLETLEIVARMGKSIAIKVAQRSGANREEKSLRFVAMVAKFPELTNRGPTNMAEKN